MYLKICKCYEDSRLPVKGHSNDSGLDLFCHESVYIPPHDCRLVGTGIAIDPSPEYFTVITSRSSTFKRGLQVNLGIIDTGYRGELKIQLTNIKDYAIRVGKDERVAQLLVFPLVLPQIEIVDSLNETERNGNGFGSTGK